MRNSLLVGVAVVVAAVLAVLVSAWFDLDLEPVALLGVAVGAVIALVPDRTALMRLAGLAGGVVVAWVGYLLRAGVLPDSPGGRAVVVALTLALAVGISVASSGRIPLWSTLLGVAAFAGAYEHAYSAAPPEVASTSVSAATTLLLTAAIGFLAAASVAPEGERPAPARARRPHRRDDDATDRLEDMMENNR